MEANNPTEPNFSEKSPMKLQKFFISAQISLRIATVATTLAATWVMLTNKQTIQIGGFSLDARYSYSSAFKFFAYANIIACGISVLSLLFLFIVGRHQGSNPNHFFFLFLLDLLMMSLVLAGCAAATAIGFVGRYGNSHTGWMAICDRFTRYCSKSTTSVLLSYLSLVFLLILTVISASKSRQIVF